MVRVERFRLMQRPLTGTDDSAGRALLRALEGNHEDVSYSGLQVYKVHLAETKSHTTVLQYILPSCRLSCQVIVIVPKCQTIPLK